MFVKKPIKLRYYNGFCDSELQKEAAALGTPKAAASFHLPAAKASGHTRTNRLPTTYMVGSLVRLAHFWWRRGESNPEALRIKGMWHNVIYHSV